jgi:hypothetical protein
MGEYEISLRGSKPGGYNPLSVQDSHREPLSSRHLGAKGRFSSDNPSAMCHSDHSRTRRALKVRNLEDTEDTEEVYTLSS